MIDGLLEREYQSADQSAMRYKPQNPTEMTDSIFLLLTKAAFHKWHVTELMWIL